MAADWRRRALVYWRVLGIAARNIGRNKTRSMFALAAIASGVAGLIVSGGFVADLIHQLGEALIHSQSGHVQIARPGYFELGARAPGKYLIAPGQAERLRALKLPHVSEVMGRVAFSALLGNGRSSYPVVGEGIEAEQEAKLGTSIVLLAGRLPAASDRHVALVGAGVARAMDLKPGSLVSLVAPTIDEAMNTIDLEVVGVFQSFSRDYDDRAVKVPLGAAQELLDSRGINVLVLLLDETRHTARVAAGLRERADARGLEVRTWDFLNDFYAKTVALYDRQFGVLQLIVLVMVLLAVLGAINVAVFERLGEFGTMRAIGNTSRDVRRLVLVEGALMGTLGAAIGVIVGITLAHFISVVGIPMPPPPNSNVEFVARIRVIPSVAAGAFAIGLAATVLSSLPAALRAGRIPIVDALRRLA